MPNLQLTKLKDYLRYTIRISIFISRLKSKGESAEAENRSLFFPKSDIFWAKGTEIVQRLPVGGVLSVAESADGSKVVPGSKDKTVKI